MPPETPPEDPGMAASDVFLAACRAEIEARPERAEFAAARAALLAAPREAQGAAWAAAYRDGGRVPSPAYRLRAAVRAVVTARAAAELMPHGDKEAAYRLLADEFAPGHPPPLDLNEERARLEKLRLEDPDS